MAAMNKTELQFALEAAQKEIETLKTKVASAERTASYQAERTAALDIEVRQIHLFLDAVPNPPARKVAGEYGSSHDVSAMTRIAVYLATRGDT